MSRIALVALVLLLPAATLAAEKLPITNDTNRVMELRVYAYATRAWSRPIRFAPSERRVVYFNSAESYYLVFIDDQGRETPVGRYNITYVLEQNPTYEVSIAHILLCTERQVEYVWRPFERKWHKVVRRSNCRRVKGKYRIVWQTH